jgi:hypothetical protein
MRANQRDLLGFLFLIIETPLVHRAILAPRDDD